MLTNDNDELKLSLRWDKQDLLVDSHKTFWKNLFLDVQKLTNPKSNSNFQDLLSSEIIKNIESLLEKICIHYNLAFSKEYHHNYYEYGLQICNPINSFCKDELIIHVSSQTIEVEVKLPKPSIIIGTAATIWSYVEFDNYINATCELLFDKQQLSDLLFEQMRIDECDSNLTLKTIEIAKNSIQSLYTSIKENEKKLVQYELYSTLYLRGRKIHILHKEFLEDPRILINELKM